MHYAQLDFIIWAILIMLAVFDLKQRRLPRLLVWSMFGLGLLRHVDIGLLPTVAAATVTALPLVALRALVPRGLPQWRLGGGDVRLAACLGAWLGAVPGLGCLAIASAMAATAGWRSRRAGQDQPLGTWCAVAVTGGWMVTMLVAHVGMGVSALP